MKLACSTLKQEGGLRIEKNEVGFTITCLTTASILFILIKDLLMQEL